MANARIRILTEGTLCHPGRPSADMLWGTQQVGLCHVNLGQAYCAAPLDLLSAMIYPSCSHPVHTQGPARAVAFRGICDRG